MTSDDLRCLKVPYSAFTGDVRFLELAESGRLQKLFMDYFFQEFDRFNRARRFSGDILSIHGPRGSDLPRKRYFAVCEPKRTDDGLLRNELGAYLNDNEAGQLLLVDQLKEEEAHFFGIAHQDNGILCILSEVAVSHFCEFVFQANMPSWERKRVICALQSDGPTTVSLPTKISRLSVCKCIDLRLPITRQWFFDRYRQGVEGWPGYGLDAADVKGEPLKKEGKLTCGFHQMLLALMDQVIGGGIASQVIGADLWRLGAEALVYPSARSDTFVIMQNEEMTDWYGWNLVDYRGTETPLYPNDVGMMMFSEGEPSAADLLKQATMKSSDSDYRPRVGYSGWDDFLSEVEHIEQNARKNPDDGPKMVIWNIDNLWWPPKAPEMRIQHPMTGPNAGSLIIEGIETSLRDKVLEFSKYRKIT